MARGARWSAQDKRATSHQAARHAWNSNERVGRRRGDERSEGVSSGSSVRGNRTLTVNTGHEVRGGAKGRGRRERRSELGWTRWWCPARACSRSPRTAFARSGALSTRPPAARTGTARISSTIILVLILVHIQYTLYSIRSLDYTRMSIRVKYK